MATIKAFEALRFKPKAGNLQDLACPPYDIISEEERKQLIQKSDYNIIRLELPRDGEDPYRQAGETLHAWLQEGILAEDESPGLYLYKETFDSVAGRRSIMGLACMVKLEEFEKGVVLPHEFTLSKAKTDRFNLMCATGCNFSGIYSVYSDAQNLIYPILEEQTGGSPLMEFTSEDGILHQVWKIEGTDKIAQISALFEQKKLYIADGHHRYETALNYRNHLRGQGRTEPGADYVMMTLTHMEHPGLLVFPTHRVVHGLENFDSQELLDALSEHFTLQEMGPDTVLPAMKQAEAKDEKVLGLVLPGSVYMLGLRSGKIMEELLPGASAATRTLDVSVLHTLILERLLGIDKENLAQQINLFYTRDADHAVSSVASGSANCAFLLGATKVEEIAAVAAAGEKMPQKSTYFYPKLITGHLMAKLH